MDRTSRWIGERQHDSSRARTREHVSQKKTLRAAERNRADVVEKRERFCAEIAKVDPDRLGASTTVNLVVSALGSPDGIVRAADGTLFVTDQRGRRVVHIDGTTVTPVATSINAPANLEFGGGSLRCDRLLVTSSGTLRVLDVGQGGAPVPWR